MSENFEELFRLFQEKKYKDLILLLEDKKDSKTSRSLNILAVSRLLNRRDTNSFQLALEEFKLAYLKEKNTKIGLEGLKNFVNTALSYYDFLKPYEDSSVCTKIFEEAISYFQEAKLTFGYDPSLISAIAKVFFKMNNLDKTLECYMSLFKKNDLNIKTFMSWIFLNNYKNNWTQDQFYNYSTLINNYIKKYSSFEEFPKTKLHNKKIRLGFLSGDLKRKHSVTYFFKSILLNYNKEKFEVILILNNKLEDETTDSFKKLVNKTINIFNIDDANALDLIRNEKIDVMFDLMGLTDQNRISLFGNRLAPIQISWLGYCNTTGLKQMDYIISDKNLILTNEEKFYSEKVIYLPQIWNCHCGLSIEKKFNPLPYSANKFITFGSFNNYSKINDEVVRTWSEILKNVVGSKLILKSSLKKDITRLKKIFENYNVLNSVVFLEVEKNFEDHLNLYSKIDIALDTFPYNGVTTSFEAIWMGVPVLTMKGFNFNSRCGESINKNIGLEELIALDKEDYILKAVELARNIEKLIILRKKLFNDISQSPLFDIRGYSKNFYASIEEIILKNAN